MVMDAISALMDGELSADDARRQIGNLKNDPALRARWDDFHLIGDALRGETQLTPQFGEALAKRLAAEPTVLAPRRLRSNIKHVTTYAMSAAASLVAVALVAWVALAPTAPIVPATALVAGPTQAPRPIVPAETPPSIASVSSEGHMNEYLLAHQGFSPSTAIQGLAPYIRSVSTTRQIEGR
jgi:sigma-E factor negative regulatory protein RseA